jgi:N6-L-threonylcarbamoyladenine synthase
MGIGEDAVQVRADIAASFQRVAVTHLRDRCRRAIEWATEDFPDIQRFVVAGGVAANSELRSALELVTGSAGLTLVCPPPLLCTDNGIMVAWAGIERWIPPILDVQYIRFSCL